MTERIGQLSISPAPREHEPGDQRGDADQHGEGVVIEVAGLQPHHVAGDVEHARGDAVRPEAVDQPAVAALPQQAAEPQRRPHEDDVVELVEVPLVEQELVERLVLARELGRQLGLADVELPGDQEAERHHHGRQHARSSRARGACPRGCGCPRRTSASSRKNSSTPWPANSSLNGKPGEDRAGRQERRAGSASPSGSRARAS